MDNNTIAKVLGVVLIVGMFVSNFIRGHKAFSGEDAEPEENETTETTDKK